ncbi:MAG TPA: cytochrome c [Gammaproteobacteria bacterium]|jgi:cytochrome c2|nr:cytochrome c [Gammaproteobacteria bacterium]
MNYLIGILLLLTLFIPPTALAFEPMLTIETTTSSHRYSRSALLSSKKLEMTVIENNRAYPNKKMTLASIKLCEILKLFPIKPEYMVEFIASDGFSVYVPAVKIMTCNNQSAIAYIAIEPKDKWPVLDNGTNTTAGPFDVIWLHPEKSYISNEYWAWSVVKIRIHKKIDNELLKLQPIHANSQVNHGYDIYVSHCAGCHTINHIGKAVIGPDLQDPKTPFDYYPDENRLKKFIRNPQSIRPGRMSGSGEDFLNESDLDALIAYLKYTSRRFSSTK